MQVRRLHPLEANASSTEFTFEKLPPPLQDGEVILQAEMGVSLFWIVRKTSATARTAALVTVHPEEFAFINTTPFVFLCVVPVKIDHNYDPAPASNGKSFTTVFSYDSRRRRRPRDRFDFFLFGVALRGGNKSNLTRRTDASRSSLPPDLSLSLLLFHGRVQFARTTNLQVDEMEIELSESLATIRVKRVYKSSHDLSDSHYSTIPTNACGDALFQLVPPNEPKLVQQKTNGHVPHRLVESPSENWSAWDSPSLMDRRCRRDGISPTAHAAHASNRIDSLSTEHKNMAVNFDAKLRREQSTKFDLGTPNACQHQIQAKTLFHLHPPRINLPRFVAFHAFHRCHVAFVIAQHHPPFRTFPLKKLKFSWNITGKPFPLQTPDTYPHPIILFTMLTPPQEQTSITRDSSRCVMLIHKFAAAIPTSPHSKGVAANYDTGTRSSTLKPPSPLKKGLPQISPIEFFLKSRILQPRTAHKCCMVNGWTGRVSIQRPPCSDYGRITTPRGDGEGDDAVVAAPPNNSLRSGWVERSLGAQKRDSHYLTSTMKNAKTSLNPTVASATPINQLNSIK
ncbi:hypothetical protein GEV33_011226 [Tenebrio molitor]|uniref:Uncharacterized protein n=1 Tax=Tenebrio molitor TaxID=7067 RepID=A0A8J6LG14_TENMO|nr:hypothetical protein GEV33_011226 [Tenebrio molitor]